MHHHNNCIIISLEPSTYCHTMVAGCILPVKLSEVTAVHGTETATGTPQSVLASELHVATQLMPVQRAITPIHSFIIQEVMCAM